MDKNKIALMVAGAVSAFSVTTYADMNIYTNEVELAQDSANQGNYEFTQTGLSGEEASVIPGFGDDMPLSLSLQIIIPSDWKVNLNQAAANMPVDWKGKTTWPYVLEQLSRDNNLQVAVDWKNRVVDVFSKEAEEIMIAQKEKEIKESEAKKVALREEATKAAKQAEIIRKEVIVEEKRLQVEQTKLADAKEYARLEKFIIDEFEAKNPGVVANIHNIYKTSNVQHVDRTEESFVRMMGNDTLREFNEAVYIVQEERMLSENMVEWAEANGWRVVWEAENDFRITNQFEKKGPLLEVVDEVISLYKKSKRPIMVKFFTKNKVIYVEDFTYEQ